MQIGVKIDPRCSISSCTRIRENSALLETIIFQRVLIRFARWDDGTDGRWRWGFEQAQRSASYLVAKYMPVRKIWGVFEKDYLQKDERVKPTSAWTMKEVNTERGSEQFIELGFEKEDFPRPKPVGLVARILDLGMSADGSDIILDFFAGSGVVAQAVLTANSTDNGNRRFILIQLPEPTDRTDYPTIAEITKKAACAGSSRGSTQKMLAGSI